MSGYRRYNPGDDAHVTDGDSGWLGVNMRLDPCQLPPGICAGAKNKRFRFGKASTRRGIVKLPYFARLGAPFPLVFPIDFEQPWPIGVNIHGAGTFDDPDDAKWTIIAADGRVFATAQGIVAFKLRLPVGVVLSGRVFFVQAVSKFYMFRGPDASTLVMEDVAIGWTEVTQENSGAGNGTGTLTIPNSSFALFFQNRLFVLYGRDEIAVSDALNMTRYSITNAFRINKGSSDALTGIYAWNDTTVVVTKEHSIYAVSNLIPNSMGDFDQARLEVVTTDWGIIAPKSMVAVGTDLLGLSQRGVVSIRQTETNKLQAVDLPLSDPIAPLIQSIHWLHAHLAVGAFWDNKYYLAIPRDSAEVEGQELLVNRYYDEDGELRISTLVPTRTYRVVLPENAFIADDVTYDATLLPTTEDVVSIDGKGTFTGTPGALVKASLRQVFKGVNNAVLVYDTLNSQWAGYDESRALMVQDFLLADYNDGERLQFVSADGFFNLYEEGFDDDIFQENLSPYLDLVVDQLPAPGDTITVQLPDATGGIVVTVTNDAVNTAATIDDTATWGCADLETAQRNLWTDPNNVGGYKHWLTTGNTVVQIAGGVRIQSQTVSPPLVVFVGSNWSYRKVGNGPAIIPIGIEDYFLSRGYMPQTEDERLLGKYVPKNFKGATMSLRTWDPLLTILTRTDGENEKKVLRDLLRKSRRKSYVWGRQAIDTMNNDAGHGNPFREDYSILLAESDQFELGPDEGVDPEILQECTEGAKLRASGKWLQVEVSGFQGRSEITSIEIKATTGARRAGAIA